MSAPGKEAKRAAPTPARKPGKAKQPKPQEPAKGNGTQQPGVASKLPRDMIESPRWLLWRAKTRRRKDGSTYIAKVPYYASGAPRSGTLDTAEDAERLATFHGALAALSLGGYSGLGFALGDGWHGVDLDKCRDPASGDIQPWAQDIINAAKTYTEVSPSGCGVHLIGRSDADLRTLGSNGSGVELYASGRYFTVTGERVGECADVADPAPLYPILEARHGAAKSATTSATTPSPAKLPAHPMSAAFSALTWPDDRARLIEVLPSLDGEGRDDWLQAGMAIHHASGGSEDGFVLWSRWSSVWEGKYDADDQRRTWASFRSDRADVVTIATLVMRSKENAARGERGLIEKIKRELRAVAGRSELAWKDAAIEKCAQVFLDTGRIEAPPQTEALGTNAILLGPYPTYEHADLIAQGYSAPGFVIEGVLHARGVVLITAPTQAGKTTVAATLAGHYASGKPLGPYAIDNPVDATRGRRKGVLVCAADDPDGWVTRNQALREHPMGVLHGADDACGQTFYAFDAFTFAAMTQKVIEYVRANHIGMTFVDTAAVYNAPDTEENAAMQAQAIVQAAKRVAIETGTTVVVFMHPNEVARLANDPARFNPRGSGAVLAAAYANLTVHDPSGAENQGELRQLGHTKFRGKGFGTITFRLMVHTLMAIRTADGRSVENVIAVARADGTEVEKEAGITHKRATVIGDLMSAEPDKHALLTAQDFAVKLHARALLDSPDGDVSVNKPLRYALAKAEELRLVRVSGTGKGKAYRKTTDAQTKKAQEEARRRLDGGGDALPAGGDALPAGGGAV